MQISLSVAQVKKVALRWARLVVRWATFRRCVVLVCNQPLKQTQPPILGGM